MDLTVQKDAQPAEVIGRVTGRILRDSGTKAVTGAEIMIYPKEDETKPGESPLATVELTAAEMSAAMLEKPAVQKAEVAVVTDKSLGAVTKALSLDRFALKAITQLSLIHI